MWTLSCMKKKEKKNWKIIGTSIFTSFVCLSVLKPFLSLVLFLSFDYDTKWDAPTATIRACNSGRPLRVHRRLFMRTVPTTKVDQLDKNTKCPGERGSKSSKIRGKKELGTLTWVWSEPGRSRDWPRRWRQGHRDPGPRTACACWTPRRHRSRRRRSRRTPRPRPSACSSRTSWHAIGCPWAVESRLSATRAALASGLRTYIFQSGFEHFFAWYKWACGVDTSDFRFWLALFFVMNVYEDFFKVIFALILLWTFTRSVCADDKS